MHAAPLFNHQRPRFGGCWLSMIEGRHDSRWPAPRPLARRTFWCWSGHPARNGVIVDRLRTMTSGR
jgi:hypothetical protein